MSTCRTLIVPPRGTAGEALRGARRHSVPCAVWYVHHGSSRAGGDTGRSNTRRISVCAPRRSPRRRASALSARRGDCAPGYSCAARRIRGAGTVVISQRLFRGAEKQRAVVAEEILAGGRGREPQLIGRLLYRPRSSSTRPSRRRASGASGFSASARRKKASACPSSSRSDLMSSVIPPGRTAARAAACVSGRAYSSRSQPLRNRMSASFGKTPRARVRCTGSW